MLTLETWTYQPLLFRRQTEDRHPCCKDFSCIQLPAQYGTSSIAGKFGHQSCRAEYNFLTKLQLSGPLTSLGFHTIQPQICFCYIWFFNMGEFFFLHLDTVPTNVSFSLEYFKIFSLCAFTIVADNWTGIFADLFSSDFRCFSSFYCYIG